MNNSNFKKENEKKEIVFFGDLSTNDGSDKTIKEVNLEKKHNIPFGTLVELEGGVRLFVVFHGRDCDGTPLYWLSPKLNESKAPAFNISSRIGGYSEESLKVIKL